MNSLDRRELLKRTAAALLVSPFLGMSLGSRSALSDDAPNGEPPKPSPEEAKKKKALEDKAFTEKGNSAIDKGQAWLLKTQDKDGTWLGASTKGDIDAYGYQALVLLALAKTGIKLEHKQMQAGLDAVKNLINQRKGGQKFANVLPGHRTYPAACVAMLLDALHIEHPKLDHDGKLNPPKMRGKLPPDARKMMEEIVSFFEANQVGIWRYPGPSNSNEDLSATQYAVLGLITAHRLGIKVNPNVFRKAMDTILSWQETSGPTVPFWIKNEGWEPGGRYAGSEFIKGGTVQARGFRYQKAGGPVCGSMTSAGVACLAIIKDALDLKGPEKSKVDKGIVDGIGWLSENFSVKENPGNAGQWHYYYLYGIERAASLMSVQYIGKHDWYREGSELLISQQQSDGSWAKVGEHGQSQWVQTAFALLFLKRATVPTRNPLPAVTGGNDEAPEESK